MAQPSNNYYSCQVVYGASSSVAVTETFGFSALWVRIANRADDLIYVRFRDGAATTADHELESSGELVVPVPMSGISLYSASTCADKPVNILAIGQ